MAIYINDLFHAAANVGFDTPGTPNFKGQAGFNESGGIVDGGAGVTTLTMSEGVDATARTIVATPKGATAAMLTVTDVDDFSFTVKAFDAAGAALDNVAFAVQVMRHQL